MPRVELGRERRATRLPPGEKGSQRGQVAHRQLGQQGWARGAAHGRQKEENPRRCKNEKILSGDRSIPSYGGEYRYAREDKGVDVRLLLFESFGGFGKGVGEILWDAANVLQNKLTRAQYLDGVTWTTKSWLGLQKQRISVVLHTAIAEQIVNELACGEGGQVHGASVPRAALAGIALVYAAICMSLSPKKNQDKTHGSQLSSRCRSTMAETWADSAAFGGPVPE